MEIKAFFRMLLDMKTILMCLITPVVLLPILYNIEGDPGRCAYGVCILIVFWVFEVLPLPVTSMLPPLLFPILGILTTGQVCAEYTKDPLMAIMGIFGIVAAVERWDLHKRIALGILILFGTKPHWLIFGVLLCTSVLSIFITAGVVVLMLPIVRGIMDKVKNVEYTADSSELQEVQNDEVSQQEEAEKQVDDQNQGEVSRLFKALSLSVAYGTTIGSITFMTGAPSGFITVALTDELYQSYGLQSKLNFLSWLLFAGPLAVINFFLTWVWLVILFLRGKGLFRRSTVTDEMKQMEKRVKEHLKQEYKRLGPWSYPEIVVVLVTFLLVVLFLTRDLYFVPGWNSAFKKGFVGSAASTAVLIVLLFIIPAKSPRELLSPGLKGRRFAAIITWTDVENSIPWGILLLIGAAFALVKACKESGLTDLIGTFFQTFVHLEPWVLTLVITSLATVFTEFMTNSSSVTMLLPVVGQLAILAHLDPLSLILPMVMAANFALMMPIANPPNAIVYSLGGLQIKDMAVAGLVLNILNLVLVNIAAQTWGKAYFQWDIFPEEMKMNGSSVA